MDKRDYKTFYHFLKSYLDPNQKINEATGIPNLMNLSAETKLLAHCLMPNHFHLLVQQTTKDGITKLMKRVMTNYVMYFNKRYNRVGPLFQGIYKAVLIDNDSYLLHLSRYIHRNPIGLRVDPILGINPFVSYPYSSYGDYLGKRSSGWVQPNILLNYFGSDNWPLRRKYRSYQSFVEDNDLHEIDFLGNLCLDDNAET